MKLIPRKYFLDDVFDDFMTQNNNTMKCDVYEKDGNYNIEVDIPGFKKEDIKVEAKNYVCHERRYGKYERSFYLGDLKTDDISAKFENGILKVRVPKVEESENKKLIEIE